MASTKSTILEVFQKLDYPLTYITCKWVTPLEYKLELYSIQHPHASFTCIFPSVAALKEFLNQQDIRINQNITFVPPGELLPLEIIELLLQHRPVQKEEERPQTYHFHFDFDNLADYLQGFSSTLISKEANVVFSNVIATLHQEFDCFTLNDIEHVFNCRLLVAKRRDAPIVSEIMVKEIIPNFNALMHELVAYKPGVITSARHDSLPSDLTMKTVIAAATQNPFVHGPFRTLMDRLKVCGEITTCKLYLKFIQTLNYDILTEKSYGKHLFVAENFFILLRFLQRQDYIKIINKTEEDVLEQPQ